MGEIVGTIFCGGPYHRRRSEIKGLTQLLKQKRD